MKYVLFVLSAMLMVVQPSHAALFGKQKFQKVFYYEHGGKGGQSGLSSSNAKPLSDGDVMDIEAGMVVEKVYVLIDTAVTGTTVLEVGDDDDPDGFVKNASVTLGTPGMYGWAASVAGDYLMASGNGGSDVYRTDNAKFYSAAGKEVKLNVTGSSAAGKLRIVVEGYKVGSP